MCNSTSVPHVERPALLSSPETSVEGCPSGLVMRPLDIVCNANRDLSVGAFRGGLATLYVLNILDLSFGHLRRMVTVSLHFVSCEE